MFPKEHYQLQNTSPAFCALADVITEEEDSRPVEMVASEGENISNSTVDAHAGPCFTITSLDEGFISGGKDGIINLWSNFCDEKLKEYAISKENITEVSTGTLLADNPPIRTIKI